MITGNRAGAISSSVEDALRAGALRPGQALPTVRGLAEHLGVSPTTVAAAYNNLQLRGLIVAAGRRGTRISPRPPLSGHIDPPVPSGAVDLASGNPDFAFLPDFHQAAARLPLPQRAYGVPCDDADLLQVAAEWFHQDGVSPEFLSIVSGGMAGIERSLEAHLRPGDRVAIEDPSYHTVHDLLRAHGLVAQPVAIDEGGMIPESLEEALRRQVAAIVETPRAQNPTGAAFDARRARDLRRLLAEWPEVLLVEDDHGGPVAGVPLHTLTTTPGLRHWTVVHSVSKWLGPDLRLAVMAGDAVTIARVDGRQRLGQGWVSYILQDLVVALARDPGVQALIEQARAAYEGRRKALVRELGHRGIVASGRSGLNVWVPVEDERVAQRALLDAGWAVAAGDQFRLRTPPGLRISVGNLGISDAEGIAEALSSPVPLRAPTRTG
ncbi:MAG: aminotransferase class I/II-fold pyridoxal phosphate-dependent enzyme [Candidatus Dormibacteraceae bacterium]